MNSNEKLKILKRYLELGWYLLPIVPNAKNPLLENGLYGASNDLGVVTEWLKRWPDANYAVRCGKDSGVVVVDVDVSNGKEGDVQLRNLMDKYGPLPKTCVQRTSSGGFHLFFKYDEAKEPKKSKLDQHIDFQAENAYVLIYPSHIGDSGYVWMDGRSPWEYDIAELPDWIYEVTASSKKDVILNDDGTVPIGQRHQYLLSLGGALRRKGEGFEVIRDALLAVYEHKCVKGSDVERERQGVVELAERLCKYEPEDPIFFEDNAEVTAKMKAVESEVALLGYVLRAPEAVSKVFAKLDAFHFLDRDCNIVYRIAKRLWAKGVTCDAKNVGIELGKKDRDIDLGRFIESSSVTNERDAEYHTDNVLESFKNREITKIYKDASLLASRGDIRSKDIISDTSTRTLSLLNDTEDKTLFNVNEQVEIVREFYEKALKGENDLNEPTGFQTFDEEALGFPKGELTFLCGRPGHMKTAAMLQIMRNMSFRWTRDGVNKHVVGFSAEMSVTQCAMRNVCAMGQIDSIALRKGLVDRDVLEYWLDEYRRNMRVFIDQTPSPTGDYMLTKTLAINQTHPVGAVFFDFIALSGETGENESLRLSQAAKKLKALAKTLNIPVVILSQLNRDIENRRPPIPRESDLSWSDSLTQLANQIIFTVYPYKFHKNGIVWDIETGKEPSPNRLLLFLSKNRDGAADMIKMLVKPEYGLIVDPADYELMNQLGLSDNLFGE